MGKLSICEWQLGEDICFFIENSSSQEVCLC